MAVGPRLAAAAAKGSAVTPRATPLPPHPPGSERYATASCGARGEHVLRMPDMLQAERIQRFIAITSTKGGKATPRELIRMAPAMCALIGACWYHRERMVEAAYPGADEPTDAEVRAYGRAVCEELQAAEYDLLDIMELFGAAGPLLARATDITAMAQRRLAFSDAQQGRSTLAS